MIDKINFVLILTRVSWREVINSGPIVKCFDSRNYLLEEADHTKASQISRPTNVWTSGPSVSSAKNKYLKHKSTPNLKSASLDQNNGHLLLFAINMPGYVVLCEPNIAPKDCP